VFWLPTGAEALYVVNAKAEVLKAALVELESRHALGRLWDLDVIGSDGLLSRSQLGIAPRRCLICQQPAHACARSQQHNLAELSAKIEEMVDDFGHTAHAA
jgi:holo-ACP synthase